MKFDGVVEAGIYVGIVALGTILYILLIKYGIPWYYCTYHYVCLN